jgi:RNA-directed DNA polymerase
MVTPETVARFKGLQSANDIAAFLRTSTACLSYHLYRRPQAYHSFSIPKASGGFRNIVAPPAVMKGFQRVILDCIASMFVPIREVHGFTVGRSVLSNARAHVRRRLVLNFDLLEFFPTVHFGRVRGLFMAKPFRFPPKVASVVAHICCHSGRLPQGAPTSPILSNLICRGLDKQFRGLARANGLHYSRYADDITFSTNEAAFPTGTVKNPHTRPPELGDAVQQIVTGSGFSINPVKTRLQTQQERQEVTGIVVNQRLNVRRTYVRDVRSALHDWKVKGETTAELRFHAAYDKRHSAARLRVYLRGKLDYLRMVRGPDDPVFCRLALTYADLSLGRPVAVQGPRCITKQIVEPGLWIVIGKDKDGDECLTASAFSTEKYGVVTAAHTFDSPNVCSWAVVRADRPSMEHPLSQITIAKHHDLACFSAPCHESGRFVLSTAMSVHGDKIVLVGFPKWSGPNDMVRIEEGQVTKTKNASMVNHIQLSTTVFAGNSGGPVFDKMGCVVAIARYDSSSPVSPNSAVSVEHLVELLGANAKTQLLPRGNV